MADAQLIPINVWMATLLILIGPTRLIFRLVMLKRILCNDEIAQFHNCIQVKWS